MTPKFTFQGKEYNSIEELPPELRKAFEKLTKVFDDKDQNGVPDFLEGKAGFTDVFKNIYHAKGSNLANVITTETNIDMPSNIDVFTLDSSPYKNPLHEKIASSSTQSTLLFFLGVLFTALVLGGVFLFFYFKQ